MTRDYLYDEDILLPCTYKLFISLADLVTPLLVPCPNCGRDDDCFSIDSTEWFESYEDEDNTDENRMLLNQQFCLFHTRCDCGVRGPAVRLNNEDDGPATLQDVFEVAIKAAKAWNDTFGNNQRKEPKKC